MLLALVILSGALVVPGKAAAAAVIGMSVANGSAQTAAPGGSVVYDIVVQNTGDTGAIVNLAVMETPPGWTVRFSSFQVNVAAGNIAAFNLTVTVPADAPADSAGKQIVVNGSYFAGGNQTAQVTIITKVLQLYGVGLASGDGSKDCGQGETAIFSLSVNNTGNGPEDIDLELVDGNYRSWANLSVPSVSLGWNERQDVLVSVHVPDGQGAGSYVVAVRAEVRGHGGAANGSMTVSLTARVFYGVELSTLEPYRSCRAGDVITFNMTVKNTGSGNDTFDMRLLEPNSDWLVGFDRDDFELPRNRSMRVMMTVRADPNAQMQNYSLLAAAVSDGDAARASTVSLTVAVLLSTAIGLEAASMNQTGSPNMTLNYSFWLINKGNGPDVFIIDILEGEVPRWASLSRQMVPLAANQYEELTLKIRIPGGILAGSYDQAIKAWSSDDPGVFSTLTFRTTVEAVFGFGVTCEEPSQEGMPGDTLTHNISVENIGNAPDSYDVAVQDLPTGWQFDVAGSNISVPAGSRAGFTVHTTIAGDFARARRDAYSYTIRLISRGNDTVGKKVALTAFVGQVFGIEIGPSMGIRRQPVDPYSDYPVGFDIVAENTGNGEDVVTLKAKRYPTGWSSGTFSFHPSAVTIMPGNTTTKLLRVEISVEDLVDFDVGTYDFDVVAVSKSRDESPPLTFTLDIVKGQIGDLQPADVVVDRTTLNKGETLNVGVTIHNSGTSNLRNVVVALYANGNAVASRTFTTTIKEGEEDQVTLEWTPDALGKYSLKIIAKYGVEEPRQLKLASNFTVTEKSGSWADNVPPWLPGVVIVAVLVLTQIGAIAIARRKAQRQAALQQDARGPLSHPGGPDAASGTALQLGRLLPQMEKIKCPSCGFIQDIPDPKRQRYVNCANCSARIRLAR